MNDDKVEVGQGERYHGMNTGRKKRREEKRRRVDEPCR